MSFFMQINLHFILDFKPFLFQGDLIISTTTTTTAAAAAAITTKDIINTVVKIWFSEDKLKFQTKGSHIKK